MRGRRAWGLLAAVLVAAALWIRLGPLPAGFLEAGRHRSVLVTDRSGRVLYESLSEAETRSQWLSARALPETLVRATLAAEDRRFYEHVGVDPLAVARAAWANLRAGRVVQGGSTLTQQVAKRLLGRRRTVFGKLREAVYALRLEHRLEKGEILALYLNLAPYGNQCEGAEAASRTYFGGPASQLTPAQAAFLAGLPQRPSALDPYRNLPGALERQRRILGRMRDLGFLRTEEHRAALAEALAPRRPDRPFEAPHFVQKVLSGREAEEDPRVRTTLDLELQREVGGILAARRAELAAHGARNAAVIVLANATGEVLAWEGSGDYFDARHGGAIDGVTTPRQPGSALKPFTYALAFEKGFTPASVLPDVPSHFPTAKEGIVYGPRNYDGRYRGPLRARKALAGSVNVPAVWLLSRVGVADLLDLLRRLGLTTLDRTADHYGFGLTLGDAEVRLDELAAAYAALARGGTRRAPVTLLGRGAAPDDTGERVLSERSAFWVSDILSDDEARAFAFGRGGSLEFPFPVAAKTGTSESYADNWALGYTREVTVGVWVGNFDRRPLRGSSGVTGAGPIFHDVLLAAEKCVRGRLPGPLDPPVAAPPEDLREAAVCALSGMPPSRACPATVRERLPEREAAEACTWHAPNAGKLAVRWPAEYRSWASSQGLPDPLPEGPGSNREGDPTTSNFVIENPPDGATYWIDPTLRPEHQALAFRVRAPGGSGAVTWTIDDRELGSLSPERPLFWPLEAGAHRLEARDAEGRWSACSFAVR